jgi:dGTPase
MLADAIFRVRVWEQEAPRPDDDRDEYQRDKARIIHSAGFRRLQAKTQVMGVGEGDFHRTRLTHSIEVGQIGEGILSSLKKRYTSAGELISWLPTADLLLAACYAHDLGHPPFGHAGEQALHFRMADKGGFEGNGQTLRILTRLEKYRPNQGMNPTRRLILAVLKYPVPYSSFDTDRHLYKPPKCYFDTESPLVDWALGDPFSAAERSLLGTTIEHGKPKHRSLDCSIMECADDIAYAVHDLEDIVARHLVDESDVLTALHLVLANTELAGWASQNHVELDDFRRGLFMGGSAQRKSLIGQLVNLFVTSTTIREEPEFSHPLLRYRAKLAGPVGMLLDGLKSLTYRLVIQRAEVQHLERRGQRIVEGLFDELAADPRRFIPTDAWASLDGRDSKERRVCDYIAGMTDPYAEKIYRRLFVPGFGSSRDEL